MKEILLIGAGRSATAFIDYINKEASQHGWHLIVADTDLELAQEKVKGHKCANATKLDVHDTEDVLALVNRVEMVVSMLPASLHMVVAKLALEKGIPFFTASYVSDEMQALDEEVRAKGLLFLNEIGLDPGIDHISAMRVIDQIKDKGCELTGFETFTGGLLAPDPDVNPWEYKFTWNPRNVVLAGQGGVKFIQQGRYKYIPYHRLFRRIELIHIPGHGYFEGYANRDSLQYLDIYGLRGIPTLFRGTLRRIGYCHAWNVFVQLGATDDTYEMEGVANMTHRQFINSFLPFNPHDSIELKLAHYVNLDCESPEMFRLKWLGLFSNEVIGLERGTPAQVLEHILKKKWTLTEDDRDMIAMWHKFDYIEDGVAKQIQSHMVYTGDADDTAMSRTVGIPLAIATSLYLQGEIKAVGVARPVTKEIYEPILTELEKHGIDFVERETEPDLETI